MGGPVSMFGEYPALTNRLVVSVDASLAAWQTVATHRVATVTGLVRIWPVMHYLTQWTSGTSTATVQWGYTGYTTSVCNARAVTELTGRRIQRYNASAQSLIPLVATGGYLGASQYNDALVDGSDPAFRNFGYEVLVEALTAGTANIYIFWTPISSDGNVVAAAGGAL